jgi:hypothetical protein
MNQLCPFVHSCEARNLGYCPTTASAACVICGRLWLRKIGRGDSVLVLPDPRGGRPEWRPLDGQRLVNLSTGEIIPAEEAQACETAFEQNRPCDRCPANISRTQRPAGD